MDAPTEMTPTLGASLPPEPVDAFEDLKRSIQVHRLLNEGIRMFLIALTHVVQSSGTGEDDRRYGTHLRILSEVTQNFEPAHPRHIQVQQNDIGSRSRFERRLLPDELQGVFAGRSVVALVRQLQFPHQGLEQV